MAEDKKPQPQAKPEQKVDPNYKHIVRIANTDLKGEFAIGSALRGIKGVGFIFANMVCNFTKIDKTKKTGSLTDAEVEKLTEVITNPVKFGAPTWMLNRRKDPETGENKHIISADIRYVQENDKKIMKKIKSYKGVRHSAGLPVRGQKTKSNFRRNKGKGSLGVKRKAGAKAGK